MLPLPTELLKSLEGIKGYEKQSFINAHEFPRNHTSIRLNPAKVQSCNELEFGPLGAEPVPWSRFGYYLSGRPSFTFDPLFHAGCYYVQEASSMFLEQVITQWSGFRDNIRVLDLSAAPGGKSTHIQSLISKESLLVSNEVIRSRARTLEENLIKWGAPNVIVTNSDPRELGELAGFFDIIIVDAPCSGSGLFRREPEAIGEWSLDNVKLCSQRQQRILADAWPSLREDGLLVYSTCSYSREEDEVIAGWIVAEFGGRPFSIQVDPAWGITESGEGYRFWPDKIMGEGLYLAAFIKQSETRSPGKNRSARKTEILTMKEKTIVSGWMETGDVELVKAGDIVYAWPLALKEEMNGVVNQLPVLYSGVRVGQLVRDKLIPNHSLALSGYLRGDIPFVEISRATAMDYLSRRDLSIEVRQKGWNVVKYAGHAIGWIKVLSNRINNYYPKEMRILKDSRAQPD